LELLRIRLHSDKKFGSALSSPHNVACSSRETDETDRPTSPGTMSSAIGFQDVLRVTTDRPRVAVDRLRATSSRNDYDVGVAAGASSRASTKTTMRGRVRGRWVGYASGNGEESSARADSAFEDDDDMGTYADLAKEEARLIHANAKAYQGPGSKLGVSRAYTVRVPKKAVEAALPGRGILEYVRLPAEEYNVLDSDAVTRVGEHTFRVAAGAQKILWLEVEPVGVISIRPTEDGCEQILRGATMRDAKAKRTGGKENGIISAMNSSLKSLRMCNRISAAHDEDSNGTGLSRRDCIRCQIDVGGTFTDGPFAAAGSDRLNGILRWCLGGVMPWFLNQLAQDYDDWAQQRPRGRREVNVAGVASEILNGTGKGILPDGVREVIPLASAFEDGTVDAGESDVEALL